MNDHVTTSMCDLTFEAKVSANAQVNFFRSQRRSESDIKTSGTSYAREFIDFGERLGVLSSTFEDAWGSAAVHHQRSVVDEEV